MKQELDVILLDDDRDICVMVEAILTYAGYQVRSCSQPDQLNELFSQYAPKLLLMDMLLSGTDGRDICRRLKAHPDTSAINIIMMSAHPDADISCREAGANDFVPKPFDMDFFLDKVKNQLPS